MDAPLNEALIHVGLQCNVYLEAEKELQIAVTNERRDTRLKGLIVYTITFLLPRLTHRLQGDGSDLSSSESSMEYDGEEEVEEHTDVETRVCSLKPMSYHPSFYQTLAGKACT